MCENVPAVCCTVAVVVVAAAGAVCVCVCVFFAWRFNRLSHSRTNNKTGNTE